MNVLSQPIRMELVGFSLLQKNVIKSGTSGRIYVPKEWINKKVRVILASSLPVMSGIASEDLPTRISIDGFEVVEKIVLPGGNSGRLYLPKHWIGSTVCAVLIQK